MVLHNLLTTRRFFIHSKISSDKINLIFGGIGMTDKILTKYSNLYSKNTNIQTKFFTFSIKECTKSKDLQKCENIASFIHNKNVHLHVMSGSCHLAYGLFSTFPDLKQNIKSQIYENPTHAEGIPDALKYIYKFPKNISNIGMKLFFDDALHSSRMFMKQALIPNIPTSIIQCNNDLIAPHKYIQQMVNNWEQDVANKKINMLETDAKHLMTIKKYPDKYNRFIIQNNYLL